MSELEGDFQKRLVARAKELGWRTAHFRKVKLAHGWGTPLSGDSRGFPDLVLVRDRVVFAELKSARSTHHKAGGGIKPDQVVWLDALRAAGAEVRTWGPEDWDEIEAVLS